MSRFTDASDVYASLGVSVEEAIAKALSVPISIHCWQADDVTGFEVHDSAIGSAGILATGSFPGRARNGTELRLDYDQVLKLVPGAHRANLHAIYAETGGKIVDRDELRGSHFAEWIEWAGERSIGLDFNPTYFAHPKAASGWTLAHQDPEVRQFWIRHGIASRRIASEIGSALDDECVNNHWIPDGSKDSPADRWSPRERLVESFASVLAEEMPGCIDSVESKLFGIGSEDYVAGSFEFYSHLALRENIVFCLDMGHFHPTETIADKLSALMQFHPRLLIHVSRPLRWDSDHIPLYNDDLRSVFLELVRGRALDRVFVALDFFDASINRIAAYVIGIRAARKALLYALLDPVEQLQRLEAEGKGAQKLALMEQCKVLPFGSIWDELCDRAEVPREGNWIQEVERYQEEVLSKRS